MLLSTVDTKSHVAPSCLLWPLHLQTYWPMAVISNKIGHVSRFSARARSLRSSQRASSMNPLGSTPASITTPVIDTRYNIRLDVIPFGLAYDQVKAYASLDGSTWYQLGSTVTLDRTSPKYRHWSDDDSKSPHLPYSQGTHNGYYVAMSSSNGKSLQTTYYVDNFEIHTDTVA